MGADSDDDLDDLIDCYVMAALRATNTRQSEGRPAPIQVAAFVEEAPTATDMHTAEAVEELHSALSLELVPQLPRVRFARSSVSPVQPFDLDDEITNIHVRVS